MPNPPRHRRRTTEHTATRKVHFLRIDGGADDSGAPTKINLGPALKKVDELPFSLDGGRYLSRGDIDLCTWVDDVGAINQLRFAAIRRGALPQSEKGGLLQDLRLAESEGLCETSHLCVFPEGIVGFEFNFYGPRPARLSSYLETTAGADCPAFVLEPLLRQDVAEVLQHKRAVRKLDLNVRRSYTSVVGAANASLGAAMQAAEAASNADFVGLYLEPEPYKRRDLQQGVLDFVREMALRPDLRDNVRRFRVTAVDRVTDQVDELDLLEDELISEKKILRQTARGRVLRTDDAYAKIKEAFAERRDELLAAAAVRITSARDQMSYG